MGRQIDGTLRPFLSCRLRLAAARTWTFQRQPEAKLLRHSSRAKRDAGTAAGLQPLDVRRYNHRNTRPAQGPEAAIIPAAMTIIKGGGSAEEVRRKGSIEDDIGGPAAVPYLHAQSLRLLPQLQRLAAIALCSNRVHGSAPVMWVLGRSSAN